MFDKLKDDIGSKCNRAKDLIVRNKIVVIFLALLVIALAVTIAVTAMTPDRNRLSYTEKEDGTLEVEKIKDTYRDGWFCRDSLRVPEQVNGKKVTSVANLCSPKLRRIVLPDSVSEIKERAFSDCTSLSEMILGNDLEIIGDEAWKNCTSLHQISLPATVQNVGVAIFDGTPIEYHTREGLNYIGNEENPYLVLIGAGSASLSEVRVHEDAAIAANACFEGSGVVNADTANLTHLPERMFAGCGELEFADISAAMALGANCFEQCTRLARVDLCEKLTAIGDRAFAGCGALKSVTIGSGVTAIGDRTFEGCIGLEEVHVSDLAAWCKIKFGATDANPLSAAHRLFVGDEEIVNLRIPAGVTSIARGAFMFCNAISSVEIPESVTAIEEYAFIGCERLKEVHIFDLAAWCKIKFGAFGANPLSVAHRLFFDGREVVNLQIPVGATSIADRAFQGFDRLTAVEIPRSVSSIGERAFEDCDALESITVDQANRHYSSRDGILYDKKINGGQEDVGKFIHIPKAIKGCVTVPAGITFIEKNAFEGCSGLQEVRFEASEGWKVSPEQNMSFSGTVSGLEDAEFAARCLTDTYVGYYWQREA